MISINFHLRNMKEDSIQSIWMMFSFNQERVRVNTGVSVHPNDWNTDKRKVRSTNDDYKRINESLKDRKDFVEEYMEDLKFAKKRFYKDDLQTAFDRHFKIGAVEEQVTDDEIHDLIAFIDYHIKTKSSNAPGTIVSLVQTRKNIMIANGLIPLDKLRKAPHSSFKDFVPEKKIEWAELNKRNILFIERFKKHLIEAKYETSENGKKISIEYSKNYVAKSLKNLKQFLNAANVMGYITDVSYKNVLCEWEEADTIYNPWEEIEAMKAVDFSDEPSLEKTRDRYVFNCYCGLRLSDLKKLAPHRFIKRVTEDEDGNKGEKISLKLNRTTKTGQPLLYPILPSAADILRKYDFQLPMMADQTYNENLKIVCLRAGLTDLETVRTTRGRDAIEEDVPRWKLVSSHTARRSFATNFYLDGVPTKQLMAITGHTTEGSFRTYIKAQQETEFNEFQSVGVNR